MAGVGPPDRRLPGRARAGPGRHGDGLRGGARRARPSGGAEGPGHARGAGLLGAAAVPERGQDRRRAAPHAHRAGLRRRPGRRALLLRHAADRGERAGPRDPPPAPQPAAVGAGRARLGPSIVRRRRPRGAGHVVVQLPVRPDLAPRLAGLAVAAAPVASRRSAAARIGRSRLGPPPVGGLGAGSVGARGHRLFRPSPSAIRPPPGGAAGRERATAGRGGRPADLSGVVGSARPAPPGLHGRTPRRGDEPPPFDPPRGSAYFRWVAAVGLQAADALAHAPPPGRDPPRRQAVEPADRRQGEHLGHRLRPGPAAGRPGPDPPRQPAGHPALHEPRAGADAGTIDGRTDVYSLGATLYELLTLRPPFDGQSAAELIDQIGRDEPVPPRKFEPRVPRDLETIVLKALAKRPADRYATAAELAEDLARFLSHEPVKARRIGPVGRLWRVGPPAPADHRRHDRRGRDRSWRSPPTPICGCSTRSRSRRRPCRSPPRRGTPWRS